MYLQSILELTDLRVHREINRAGQTGGGAEERNVAQHGVVHHCHTAQLTAGAATIGATSSSGGFRLLMTLPTAAAGRRRPGRKHEYWQHACGVGQRAAAHRVDITEGLCFGVIVAEAMLELHLQCLLQPHNRQQVGFAQSDAGGMQHMTQNCDEQNYRTIRTDEPRDICTKQDNSG